MNYKGLLNPGKTAGRRFSRVVSCQAKPNPSGAYSPKRNSRPPAQGRGGGRGGGNPSSSVAEQQQAMLQALREKSKDNGGDLRGGGARAPANPPANLAAATPDFTTVKKGKGPAAAARKFKSVDGAIYDHPMYYDWAFGFREYEVEVDFLFDVYELITGAEPTSFVELGCGPAQHSLEMAESGIDVVAVDVSQSMLDYAADLASEDDLSVSFLRQDMRELALPDGKQVDMVGCMLGTFQHMLTMDDALRCMMSAAGALKPGGLFAIELSHPALLFDGSVTSSADLWDVELPEAQVEVFWGKEGDRFNAMTQVLDKNVRINIMMRGGEMLRLDELIQMRQFTYQELLLLASSAGLAVECAYGDFDMDARLAEDGTVDDGFDDSDDDDEGFDPIDDEDDEDRPYRMILLLRKPASGLPPDAP